MSTDFLVFMIGLFDGGGEGVGVCGEVVSVFLNTLCRILSLRDTKVFE